MCKRLNLYIIKYPKIMQGLGERLQFFMPIVASSLSNSKVQQGISSSDAHLYKLWPEVWDIWSLSLSVFQQKNMELNLFASLPRCM